MPATWTPAATSNQTHMHAHVCVCVCMCDQCSGTKLREVYLPQSSICINQACHNNLQLSCCGIAKCIVALLHCYIAALLHCCIAALLHYCNCCATIWEARQTTISQMDSRTNCNLQHILGTIVSNWGSHVCTTCHLQHSLSVGECLSAQVVWARVHARVCGVPRRWQCVRRVNVARTYTVSWHILGMALEWQTGACEVHAARWGGSARLLVTKVLLEMANGNGSAVQVSCALDRQRYKLTSRQTSSVPHAWLLQKCNAQLKRYVKFLQHQQTPPRASELCRHKMIGVRWQWQR